MMPFAIAGPRRILFGRGTAAQAAVHLARIGGRGVIVHGRDPARAAWLLADLAAQGCDVVALTCAQEPTLAILDHAVIAARAHAPDWIAALGGGAALDLGKAVAALVPAPGVALDHLEVVGRALPLCAPPLPFVALPTTSGTGAEATRNAVIGLPDHGRKVSLRDDGMYAVLAIVDPALTDGCPRTVTMSSGLDAITQVIEPYLSSKATPYTDALCRPAIAQGLAALNRLSQAEDTDARDTMAWVSLCGGLALGNAGLGAVHGLAGVIGGVCAAPHGEICGTLLGPALTGLKGKATGDAAARLAKVEALIAAELGGSPADAANRLASWAAAQGLRPLGALGVPRERFGTIAEAAKSSSSMKGSPVALSAADLVTIMSLADPH